jgi:hypothetical protein
MIRGGEARIASACMPAAGVLDAGAVGRVEERRLPTTGCQGDDALEEHAGERRTGLRGGGSRWSVGQGATALMKILLLIQR